jgi:hypothetical protein
MYPQLQGWHRVSSGNSDPPHPEILSEFSQHDFGQVEVEFLHGVRQPIHFFASRLKYSSFMRVSLVKDETVESLVRTLAEHLAS